MDQKPLPVLVTGSSGFIGRHNRAAGFAADLEKYLGATLDGWRVIRPGPDEVGFDTPGRIKALLTGP